MNTPRRRIELADVSLPDFGLPEHYPVLSAEHYRQRSERLFERMRANDFDSFIVYADREHFANFAYFTGFEPRFEEALLILIEGKKPVVVTGPENQSYALSSPIDLSLVNYPPFGLLGQDRSSSPILAEVFRTCGVSSGSTIGIAGWKYFNSSESPEPENWIEAPAFIVDTVRNVIGPGGRAVNATRLLMDSSHGLRAINEVEQLAQFEYSACHVSEAVKRVLTNVKPGMREFEAAQLLMPLGLPLSCHTMLSSNKRTRFGLASPSDQLIEEGKPFSVAFGVWGALCCRAGWLVAAQDELPAEAADYLERLVKPYFDCVVEWYETIGIGVTGGEIDALVKRHLGDPFFGVALNPGHLIHLDEWMNTPIYPASQEQFQSGQAIQIDIIPATNSPYFSTNIEDGIALLDSSGRAEFNEKFPDAWQRIEARREFMHNTLGIRLKPEVLPFSNLAATLSPFLLAPRHVMVCHRENG